MPVTTIADLLRLLTREPGRPRITWYGHGGERVELSGAVLENWVNKTTNLLVEELDVQPGTRVLLDVPMHWRTATWALATWRAGGTVVLADSPDASGTDVTVTDRPDAHADGRAQLVVVSLPALARRYDGTLPAGALDAASSVMTYGDVIGWAPAADPSSVALEAHDLAVPHAELFGWAAPSTGDEPAVRELRSADAGAVDAAALAGTLRVLAADGSVVLVDTVVAGELAADPDRRDRLASSERITRTAG
ncbi:TIGR03089 family protein [Cellulomonas sp. Root485]|uniref:TIGR03089 family protein n=1 Tax=Cellulomonas sp. Root485 TaxID=1736546 RepID=UPI000A5D4797